MSRAFLSQSLDPDLHRAGKSVVIAIESLSQSLFVL